MGIRAAARFKNLLVAKCFQPWAKSAHRAVLAKHQQQTEGNFAEFLDLKRSVGAMDLDDVIRKVEDHDHIFTKIFNKPVLDSSLDS